MRTPARRAAVLMTVALTLSSCGRFSTDDEFLDQTPRAMATTAFEEMGDVTSMRLLGNTETDGGSTRVDLRLDGTNCVGSLDTDDGGFSLITNSDGAWFKPDDRFWKSQAPTPRQGDALLDAYGGAWVVLEGKNDFRELCDLEALLAEFELEKDDTEDTIHRGEVEKVGDADAIAMSGGSKERTTIWIAVQPPHRVLKMAPTNDRGAPEALYFEDFDAEVVAESPPKEDIVTLPGR